MLLRGRHCHSLATSTTFSVMLETAVGEMSAPLYLLHVGLYISSAHPFSIHRDNLVIEVTYMIRNSFKYVPHKHSKEFMGDLKLIYRAETEDKATDGLKKLQEKWDTKYPLAVRSWVNQWEHVKTFFKYPPRNKNCYLYHQCCRISAQAV